MPRAATTWLCRCFNEHPETAAFGESMFFGRRFIEPQPDGTYTQQQVKAVAQRLAEGGCIHSVTNDRPGGLKRVSSANLPQIVESAVATLGDRPTPAQVYRAFTEALAQAEGKRAAIEKTPHHLNWLDRIFTAFPDARVIVLLREPYAFMLSYKHQGDRQSERVRKQLARLYHPMACAMVWRASMRSALAARSLREDQVFSVEQEDIRSNAAEVMDNAQRFFGLEPVDLVSKVPPDNTSFPGGVRPRLQPEDIFWMNMVAGRTMSRGGYVKQPAGLTPTAMLRVAWSVLRLPIWSVGCLLTLRQVVDGSLMKYIMRWFRPARPQAATTD